MKEKEKADTLKVIYKISTTITYNILIKDFLGMKSFDKINIIFIINLLRYKF